MKTSLIYLGITFALFFFLLIVLAFFKYAYPERYGDYRIWRADEKTCLIIKMPPSNSIWNRIFPGYRKGTHDVVIGAHILDYKEEKDVLYGKNYISPDCKELNTQMTVFTAQPGYFFLDTDSGVKREGMSLPELQSLLKKHFSITVEKF